FAVGRGFGSSANGKRQTANAIGSPANGQRPTVNAIAEIALLLLITLRFAWWTWPALEDARTNPSPPAAALAWAAQQPGTIYAHGSVGPMADALLPQKKYVITEEDLPVAPKPRDLWVTEGSTDSLEQRVFQRPHHRLWQIVRQRYFEVSAAPIASIPLLGDGWWSEESDGRTEWRWMGSRSVTNLAAVGGHARLTLRVICATEKQSVDVTLNRKRVATFDCNQELSAHEWTLDSRANARNELVLTTNRVVTPARDFGMDDRRDLGVRVEGIGWKAAP
ncbi:MAG TPA: hypothetical protein VMU84_13625, partial [Thermoanaerobaculia bacterium]|nr:hypothetical protein [Thermoanaerobaculia bacterium]